jgi:hypothetical protein
VRRWLNVYNQAHIYVTAKVSLLKDFELCPSDLEISPDGNVRSPYVKAFARTNEEHPDDSEANFMIAEGNRVSLRTFPSLTEYARLLTATCRN